MFTIPFVTIDNRAYTNVDIEHLMEVLNIDEGELYDSLIDITTEYGADYNTDYIFVSSEMINSPEYESFLRELNNVIINLDVNDIDINCQDDDNDLFVSSIIYEYGIEYARGIHNGDDFIALFDNELMSNDIAVTFKRDIIQGFINVVREMNAVIHE